MTFDTKKFMQTKFRDRTEYVPVPDLKAFFTGKSKPRWKIKGLTGKELGLAKQAAAKNKSLKAIAELLKSAKVADKVEALNAVFDLDPKGTTENIAERLEQLVLGSIEPICTLDLALRICRVSPVDFYNLTNRILELTGKGMLPGEPKDSGKKRTSESV